MTEHDPEEVAKRREQRLRATNLRVLDGELSCFFFQFPDQDLEDLEILVKNGGLLHNELGRAVVAALKGSLLREAHRQATIEDYEKEVADLCKKIPLPSAADEFEQTLDPGLRTLKVLLDKHLEQYHTVKQLHQMLRSDVKVLLTEADDFLRSRSFRDLETK